MSNATRWYCTVDAVKTAVGLAGADLDVLMASYIEAASEDIEAILGRRFIPETAIKYFRWPPKVGGGYVLQLDDLDLIAVTLLQAAAQDAVPVTIVAADFFTEPVNTGPPYTRIEIDQSSAAAFQSGDTAQRSIAVTGRWGYGEDAKAAGALAEDDDGSETGLDVTDSSLIGVGDTILIGGATGEAMFVSAKGSLDTTATTVALTANKAETTVGVNTGTLVKAGEVITVDSERMLVESISGNNLTVQRAYDGSILALHVITSKVYAPRTLTVVRAVNGTTAAAHATATAIKKYAPPADIMEYCRAHAIAHHQQGRSGWTGVVPNTEGGAIETKMFGLWAMKQALLEKYGKVSL
ncbi:MAG: hypothetical protein MUP14_07790 [Dehalococcoidia bacterium]|nr:hypothetical protein [Dehalococcoidia bacterium]